MTVESTLEEAGKKMRGSIAVLTEQFSGIRTGRATPALLSRVSFDYYGTQQPLKDMASISVPEPRMLVIQPFDKGAIGATEKELQKLTDQFVAEVDEVLGHKEKELLEV